MKDNFIYMLSNWLKWDKKSLKFFFLWVPALVLQPLVTAYIPKAMIDAIGKGVTVQNMTVIVALLSLLLTLTSGKLNSYLVDIEQQAQDLFSRLVKDLAEKECVTEKLKSTDMMLWVQKMNSIRNRITEIVNKEIIYI